MFCNNICLGTRSRDGGRKGGKRKERWGKEEENERGRERVEGRNYTFYLPPLKSQLST